MSDRVAIRAFLASGGRVLREGDRIALQGEAPPALAQTLRASILPVPDPAAALGVRELLRARAGRLYAIRSEAEAREAAAVLAAAPVLGFDVETEVNPEWRGPVEVRFTKAGDPAKRQPRETAFALDPLRSKPRLVQLFARPADGCFVFDMRAVPWFVLAPVLTSSKLIAANAIFDLKRVLQVGIVPRAAGDPLRLAALTHGLVRGVSLASLAKLVLEFDVPKEFARSDWSADTLSRAQWEYAALDAVLALDVYRELVIRLSDDERQVVRLVEANLVPAARMELAGVPFDAAAHSRMVSGWKAGLVEAEAAMVVAAVGCDLRKPAPMQAHLAAHVPADRLAAWPRTKSGALAAERDLLKANQDVAGIRELLAYRKLAKLNEVFGAGLAVRVHPVSGRLHPSVNLAATKTGRYTMTDPNLQQSPRGEYRSVFTTGPGGCILSFDYSQIELRIVGHVVSAHQGAPSKFDRLFAETGIDIHEATARDLFTLPTESEITPEQRQTGKVANFALCYGMGTATFHAIRLADNPQTSFEESTHIRNRWRDAYADVARWQADYSETAHRQGYTETMVGRRWYWKWNTGKTPNEEEPEDVERGDGFRYCFAMNHVVQGTAAELLQLAIVRVDRALVHTGARMIATVHDELVLECPEADVTAVAPRVVAEMVAAYRTLFPQAPVAGLVDAGCGNSWAAAKSATLDIGGAG